MADLSQASSELPAMCYVESENVERYVVLHSTAIRTMYDVLLWSNTRSDSTSVLHYSSVLRKTRSLFGASSFGGVLVRRLGEGIESAAAVSCCSNAAPA